MSVNQQAAAENTGQSLGSNPKPSNKRNSGIFTFFKWLKPFTSRESINTDSVTSSSSCESVDSIHSDGTVASFSFIPPSAYKNRLPDKYVPQTPETDTYRARLRQRDNRRENEKNLTLRKKYNLFFNRDTLKARLAEEDSSRSLPLMTKKMEEEEEKMHRRTASESSKVKRAGAYCHVKGKRKAPQPPGAKVLQDGNSTMSLKRKKRLAPSPPEVLCNDSLKLDHGVLKSVKEDKEKKEDGAGALCDTPLSPKPWYKRNPGVSKNKEKTKESRGSDVAAEETKKKEEKRKSGMSFLTNISELDREATEIIQKEYKKASVDDLPEIPEFMRPKQESKINTDSWASPKRKSARDLIAKFNAITNVTKVTVNSAFFGSGKQYFEKQTSLDETKRPPTKLDQFRKKSAEFSTPLMKSESTSAIKPRAERSPKPERENWRCPRCQRENDYWRIICCVCSNIKPYFDELVTNPGKNSVIDQSKTQNAEIKRNQCSVASKNTSALKTAGESPERILERSKTQIGFSALVKYNEGKPKQENADFKKEEKEKLKKMLIEMKNSLPKKKLPLNTKQNSRASVIEENNDENGEDNKENKKEIQEEPKETKSASVVIATTETIYENIKMKRTPDPKPLKVSSSAQTSSVVNKVVVPSASNNKENLETKISVREKNDSSQNQAASCFASENQQKNYQLLRPKDFEGIYSDKLEKTQRVENVYQNLAKNDDLSLFFNVPKRFSEIKKEFDITSANNTDTLEINRLLKRLENAIAKGEMVEASLFARELAQLKVNCSVVRQKSTEDAPKGNGSHFMVEMYVEDKISHRGPFPIKVMPQQTVRELKLQVEKEFEIPVAVQRWILGKELASNDEATLADVRVNTEGCPIFLYLVAPTNDTKSDQESKIEEKPKQEIPKTAPNSKIHEKLHQTSNISPISNQVESTNVKITPRPSTGNSIETGGLLKPSVKNSEKNPNKSEIPEDVPSTSGGISKLNTKSDTATNIKIGSNVEEEPEDYDVKTLKPQCNEWECPRCTLLNPKASNICGACSSIRVRIPKVELERPKRQKGKAPMAKQEEASGGIKEEHYLQLLDLDNADLVENTETFECLVCFLDTPPKAGVTLRECLHQFCKHCLRNTVEYSEEAEVKCPYRDATYSCDIALQDREIKALVPKAVYDQYLAKSVTQAENKIDKSFHCKTPDCKGWCVYEDNANEFRCPICRRINCLTCQAIHTGLNCKQYQERMNAESETDEDAKRTKEMLQEMLNKGEALTCPTCQVILMKKWGCDWLRCSMCKTEICWVTRGPRWGPAGKGDTSGGCQCGVNGVKCHPQCNYCH